MPNDLKRLMVAIVVASLAFVVAFAARAEGRCGPTPAVEAMLAGKYGERPVLAGIAMRGEALMRVWSAADGATWTATITYPARGLTCLVADGEALAPAAAPAAPPAAADS